MRSDGMRGQAFVVFTDMVTAANAMREAQNNQFFNKVLPYYFSFFFCCSLAFYCSLSR